MKKNWLVRLLCVLLVVCGIALVGCKSSGGDAAPADDATAEAPADPGASGCTCETAKVDGGWCADCKVGYVDGEKTQCEGCAQKQGECDTCASQ